MRLTLALAWGLSAAGAAADVAAAELRPRTAAAFDLYARATEAALDTADRPFLRIDGLADAARRSALDAVGRGQSVIEPGVSLDRGRKIDVPDGLIHHWVGTVFIPGVPLEAVVGLMQDYNRHAELFRPNVARSTLVSRNGDEFRVSLRFFMKKVISVVVNTDNEATFRRVGPDRVESRIRSVRVAEVDQPDTPAEKEKPVGDDGGFVWRLNTYWRFLAREGGTYVQCEAISLSRGIPFGFGWLIGPFVTSIPRESLTFTLERMLTALKGQAAVGPPR